LTIKDVISFSFSSFMVIINSISHGVSISIFHGEGGKGGGVKGILESLDSPWIPASLSE
jgi:hypothetical protein